MQLCGLSTMIGHDDLRYIMGSADMYDRFELINDTPNDARLPGDLGQTFFENSGAIYAYHNLDRASPAQFVDFLHTGLTALTAVMGAAYLDEHTHPQTPYNPALGAWLSRYI